ncbi:LysR family transcriptional regulator [Mycolicibacterium madagascariense]|uniref:Probable hydrogen peroxide-inducible genes activator n=1 Tax=Mycolicibacterium madagascariense TaxID=212765 RepID=A0A7I7XDY8_9MYCO|nr:LysR substrate-binding domain-containing protein [Mycolicibacterium madagascariense]MCV7015296.1 LysR family transcriptional regulator [Mycolicibacterium madagascariense]BBZ27590.1 LysR family transcriptional regulator [Mycolicibacterium madagascariense]
MDLRLLRYFVAVAEERHVGRAASRLHMTQPPLSRAIRQLEEHLGVVLMERTLRGITLTAAGTTLYDGARAVLEQVDRLEHQVLAAAGARHLVVGTLADAAERLGRVLVDEFRRRHPEIGISIHEVDLGDPSAGLRSHLVDVAVTRTPFADNGISTHRLRTEAVGMVVRDDDPLAGRESVRVAELADRTWVRLPTGTDDLWCRYWTVAPDATAGPVMRTIQECLQSVMWNGTYALAPLDQQLPEGLTLLPVDDRPPSHLVVAWRTPMHDPAIQAFIDVASDVFSDER